MTNQRRISTHVSNSTFDTIVSPSKTTQFDNNSDIFLDYHPKIKVISKHHQIKKRFLSKKCSLI
jgi:hypothetical protein